MVVRYLLWFLMAVFAVIGGIFAISSFASSEATARPYALEQDVSLTATDPLPTSTKSMSIAKQETGAVSSAARRADGALVSPDWATATSVATGIPQRALVGYAGASLALAAEQPDCHLGWTTLAALGWIESGHGTHAGSRIANNGVTTPAILGPSLDGTTYAAITSTDSAAGWDRAMGPLQFISSTWASWGADGNGDGVQDPQQIDDAALAAGRYLCHYGDLSNPDTWRTAVFAYNHVTSYVDSVAAKANDYNAMIG